MASVFTGLGSINDDRGKEETNCDAELVTRNQSTTDFSWTDLGHVHDDSCEDMTDTKPCNETASDDKPESLSGVVYGSCGLDDYTNNVSQASDNDGRSTTKEIG